MEQGFYRLPFLYASIFEEEGENMKRCSEKVSIDQYIELILSTCPGEHRYNARFGCAIWEMDFESVTDRIKWETDFKGHILESIQQFEKRLKEVNVNIHLQDVVREDKQLQSTAIKKKVTVVVDGMLRSTDEYFSSHYEIYLGPLSSK